MPFCLNAIYLAAGKQESQSVLATNPPRDILVRTLVARMSAFGIQLVVDEQHTGLGGAMVCLTLRVEDVNSDLLIEGKVGKEAERALGHAPEAAQNVCHRAVHALGRAGACIANAAASIVGKETVTSTLNASVESKISASLPCKLTGPVDGHPGLQVVVLCNSVEYNQTWIEQTEAEVKLNTLSWTMGSAQHFFASQDKAEYMVWAKNAGLLRPWWLLASMQPEVRGLMGHTLGLDGLREASGDSGPVEAWHLLVESGGVCQRVGGAMEKAHHRLVGGGIVPWTEILMRLLRKLKIEVPPDAKALDSKSSKCEANCAAVNADGEISIVGHLERLLMQHMQARFLDSLELEDRAVTIAAGEELGNKALATANLQEFGPLALLAAGSGTTAALGNRALDKLKILLPAKVLSMAVLVIQGPVVALGVKAASLGYVAVASDPLACDSIIQEILLERLRLLLVNVDLDAVCD